MNQKLIRLKYLRDKISEIEMQIGFLESDMVAIEKDLVFLEKLCAVFEENLKTIRAEGVVVSALEYKKIIQEFMVAKKNLAYYSNLHLKLLNDFDKLRVKRERAMVEYEEFKVVCESIPKVVQFDQSRRKK